MKVKKLFSDATVPTRGSAEAAGYDLYAYTNGEIMNARHRVFVKPGCTTMFHTGIAVQIPKGYFGAVFARSGLASKKGLRPANCVGVIDSDYTGEVMVALHNDSSETQFVDHGDRIAQLVIIPYRVDDPEVVEDLDDTTRGDGGFGSTGK